MPTDLAPVANHLWQSTFCVIAVWLLTLALKRNRAAVRYWLWLAASVKFLVPFSLLVGMGAQFGWRTAPATAMTQPQWSSVVEDIGRPFAASAPSLQAATQQGSNLLPAILLSVWLCGFLGSILLWVRAWQQIRATRRDAVPLGLGLPIPVMLSPTLVEPGVLGVFRPVLLLPNGITDRLTPSQLNAVLAHEMCHVRRRDNLTAAIHMLVEGVFWFYPLVWWIRTRLVAERERACDEAVLESGSDAEAYAEGILSVCKSYLESSVQCVSGISGADLKKRIVWIMAEDAVACGLDLYKKLLLSTAAMLALALPVAFGLLRIPEVLAEPQASVSSTADWQSLAGGHLEFEVASVRLSEPGSSRGGNISMNEGDYLGPTGGLFTENFPLVVYIVFAYKLSLDHEQEKLLLDSLPKWAATQMFAVHARASSSNPTKDQYRLMMQSLLADRFRLASHIEQRKVPVFALALVKPGTLGPDLRFHSNGPPCNLPASENGSVPSSDSGTPARGNDSFPFNCGRLNFLVRPNNMVLTGSRDVTIAALAMWLSGLPPADLTRPVVDQTGLDGRFDFSLKWSFVPPNFSPEDATNQPEFMGLTLERALKEQLGLYLKPTIAPLDFFVVDHVEMPSAN